MDSNEIEKYHYCVHEVDWGSMQQRQEQMDVKLEKILKAVQGNGVDGLMTRMALHNQAIKRIWGFISVAIAGLIGAFIYGKW